MPELVPQLLSLVELADALRVSPHTIRAWCRKRRLVPIRLCRRLLFHPEEVQRFLEEARDASTGTPANSRTSGTPDHVAIWGAR